MKRLLLTCFAVFLFKGLWAAHIIGGIMTYECLGPNADNTAIVYRFTMKVYRDCQGNGAQFDSSTQGNARTGYIAFYRGIPGATTLVEAFFALPPPVVEDLVPSLANNPCVEIPSDVCVQEGVYTFTRELPELIDESYYAVYQRCCRNATIDNILDPGGTGSTYFVEITPESQASCNNSPFFNEFPPIVICANEPFIYDHSASDLDGDQLEYEFCSPLRGGTRNMPSPDPDPPPPYFPVNFIGPTYTAAQPINGSPPLSIDRFTGEITGMPTLAGQYVVGVCVSEYRNGELIGQIQRDFQFNVTSCDPLVDARLDGNLSTDDTYYFNQCVDSTVVLDNISINSSPFEEILWRIEGAGVNGLPLSTGVRDLTITVPGPGSYPGWLAINPGSPCGDTAFFEINISPNIAVDFESDYDTCIAGPVSFTDMSDTSIAVIESRVWQFGDGTTGSGLAPVHDYTQPDDYLVRLTITDTMGCVFSDLGRVTWFPVPPLIIVEPSASAGCPPLGITLNNLSTPINDSYITEWDFGDGGVGEGISPDYTYTETGTYDVTIDITSPIGCFTTKTFENLIFVDTPVVADFSYTSTADLSNFNPTAQFTDESKQAVFWEWTFNGLETDYLQNPAYTFPDTGLQEIRLVASHLYGCTDTIIKYVDIVPQIRYFLPNAFTPNNDGTNEEFQPAGFFRGIRNYEMIIWNRWGQVVYEGNAPEEGWNGQYNNTGKALPTGVYVYEIHFDGPRGKPHEYRGFATLVR